MVYIIAAGYYNSFLVITTFGNWPMQPPIYYKIKWAKFVSQQISKYDQLITPYEVILNISSNSLSSYMKWP